MRTIQSEHICDTTCDKRFEHLFQFCIYNMTGIQDNRKRKVPGKKKKTNGEYANWCALL